MNSIEALEARRPFTLRFNALWDRARAALACLRVRRRPRQLHLRETLSLGDKRMIAVVEFDRRRFLVAATPQRISLLQDLGPNTTPEESTPRIP